MSNTLAICIGIIVIGALAADIALYESAGSVFLARRGLGLIEWIAFWR